MSKKSQYGQRTVRGVGAVVVGPAAVLGSAVEATWRLLIICLIHTVIFKN